MVLLHRHVPRRREPPSNASVGELPEIANVRFRGGGPPRAVLLRECAEVERKGDRGVVFVVKSDGDGAIRESTRPEREVAFNEGVALRRDVLIHRDRVHVEQNFALERSDPRRALRSIRRIMYVCEKVFCV